MNKLLLIGLLAAVTQVTAAPVARGQLGTGTPAQNITVGIENASLIGDGVYHLPQYMPGFPTAATIWPRVVEVDCEKSAKGTVVCEGYHWTPRMGRGEYLFIVPKMKAPPVVTERVLVKEQNTVTTVIKEVPVKPGRE